MDCVFCKIVSGDIPSEKVYEDENSLAFLDIRPVHSGHMLLIPKTHHPMMTDTPDELIEHLFVKAKELMVAVKKATSCDFAVLSVVGVDVPHFHIHVIPRFFHDGLANFWPQKEYQKGAMGAVGKKIRRHVKEIEKN